MYEIQYQYHKTKFFDMTWLVRFFNSSIGQKLLMSFTGLFLCLFLTIHLLGNLQLLNNDGGEAFNAYAAFMTHNPLIKVVSYANYFFILLHAFKGITLWLYNKRARGGVGYQVTTSSNTSFSARNMAFLGSVIFIFIVIHMRNFWYEMHWGDIGMDMQGHRDLYLVVLLAFKEWWYVLLYVASMIALAYHLIHGFSSAFQSLGVSHPKYTPVLKFVGRVFGIVVPLAFAIIPIYMYLYIPAPTM